MKLSRLNRARDDFSSPAQPASSSAQPILQGPPEMCCIKGCYPWTLVRQWNHSCSARTAGSTGQALLGTHAITGPRVAWHAVSNAKYTPGLVRDHDPEGDAGQQKAEYEDYGQCLVQEVNYFTHSPLSVW